MAARKNKKKNNKNSQKNQNNEAKQESQNFENVDHIPAEVETKKRRRKISLGKLKFKKQYIVILVIAILAFVGVYYYIQFSNTQSELLMFKQNPQEAATQDLLKKVGELVELPQNEVPTIATITDADLLNEQPFFTNAQNGDKILIYKNNQRTVLYRPLTNKIVETLSVSIENADQLSASEPNTPKGDNPLTEVNEATQTSPSFDFNDIETVKIVVLNGSGKPGFASEMKDYFEDQFVEFDVEVIRVGNANSYLETTFAPVTQLGEQTVTELEDFVGGNVLPLEDVPEAANEEEADVVLIIGTTYEFPY